MSVDERQSRPTESPTNTDSSETLPDSRYRRLHAHLSDRLEGSDAGEVYVKGKYIADEIDLSPRQIGALIVELQKMDTDIDIEKWSYTGATTWRVTPA